MASRKEVVHLPHGEPAPRTNKDKSMRIAPCYPGARRTEWTLVHCLDIGRLVALGAGGHIEGNLLVFLECLETTALNRGEVRKEILAAAIGSNKTKTLGIVKPFHSTCSHYSNPRKKKILGLRPVANYSRARTRIR